MGDHKEELKLIRMNEVKATEISLLWYPYIHRPEKPRLLPGTVLYSETGTLFPVRRIK